MRKNIKAPDENDTSTPGLRYLSPRTGMTGYSGKNCGKAEAAIGRRDTNLSFTESPFRERGLYHPVVKYGAAQPEPC